MTTQDQILQLLKDSWPEGCSITKMVNTTKLRRSDAENETQALVTSGRVSVSLHSYYATYRLTHEEAVKQGIDMTPTVKGRTDQVYSRPSYKPTSMAPARHDAEQAMQVMSRRGDAFVPFQPPIHMGSNIAGGMR